MSSLFDKNLEAITERWPQLSQTLSSITIEHLSFQLVEGTQQTIQVNGFQLSSRYDRFTDVQLQFQDIPAQPLAIDIYGIGMGDNCLYALMQYPQTQVHVHILNLAVFKMLLTYTEQSDWLKHPQLTLHFAPPATASNSKLSTPHVFSLPDLMLCEEPYASIRDILLHDANLAFVNHQQSLLRTTLMARIEQNLAGFSAYPDVSQLIESALNEQRYQRAIVIASGPSLESHYFALKQLMTRPVSERGVVIAVDTALRGLAAHQIRPDFVITVDHAITPERITTEFSEQITLVFSLMTRPEVIEAWQGDKYTAVSMATIPVEYQQQLADKTNLYISGSVLHPAVDLAVRLGAKKVALLGADFGFVGQKSHAGWDDLRLVGQSTDHSPHWVLDGEGNRLPTLMNFRGYLRALEQYIAQHPEVSFTRASKQGAMIQGSAFEELSLWLN